MGSRAGEIYLDWAGERRLFRLRLGELRKIQEETGCGPTGLAARCMMSLGALQTMRERDLGSLAKVAAGPFAEPPAVRFTILQALLGADVPSGEATALVKTWCDEGGFADNLLAVYQICMAAILGPEDEQVGETEGGRSTTTTRSPKEASGSRTTTEPARSQVSARAKSTNSRSGKSR
jgi:hypothetical protein